MKLQRRIVLFVVLFPAVLNLTAQENPAPRAPTSKHTDIVSGQGCVQAATEPHCLVVEDRKAHQTYNVFFKKGNSPKPGTAISFEGLGYNQPSHCQEGKP